MQNMINEGRKKKHTDNEALTNFRAQQEWSPLACFHVDTFKEDDHFIKIPYRNGLFMLCSRSWKSFWYKWLNSGGKKYSQFLCVS